MPFALLPVVTVLLSVWAFRRRRRILADGLDPSVGAFDALSAHANDNARSFGRTRPALADIGLNPLGRWLVALNVAVLGADVLLFSIRGLTLEWSTTWLGAVLLAALLIVWLNFYFVPGARDELFVAEALFVVLLMLFLTNVASPMQYGAVALGAPTRTGGLPRRMRRSAYTCPPWRRGPAPTRSCPSVRPSRTPRSCRSFSSR